MRGWAVQGDLTAEGVGEIVNKYLSDLHLGHANILRMSKRREGFADVDEMNAYIIRRWNENVDDSDDVWIPGDFSYRSGVAVETYLNQMKGHKHLVIGNHDAKWMKNTRLSKYFDSVSNMEVIKDGKKIITICHYPMMEWEQSRRAKFDPEGYSWLVHGHIHDSITCGAYQYIREFLPCALNACFEINDHPVTLEELIENNKNWYSR